MNGIGRTVMAEITEQTFEVKKGKIIVATIILLLFICIIFFTERDYSSKLLVKLDFIMAILVELSFLGEIIWMTFIRPTKIVVNSAGIYAAPILGKKQFVEWNKIKKIKNYRKHFGYILWPFLKYTRIEADTSREKLFLPLFLEDKAKFDKIMREMIDDEKVLKKLGVV